LLSIETVVALPTRRDGASDDSLTHPITGHGGPEFLDRADRLVPDDAAALDQVFGLHDVDISSADRRGRDANQSVCRANTRDRFFIERYATGLYKKPLPSSSSFENLLRYLRLYSERSLTDLVDLHQRGRLMQQSSGNNRPHFYERHFRRPAVDCTW
jgi:hypothetical protein